MGISYLVGDRLPDSVSGGLIERGVFFCFRVLAVPGSRLCELLSLIERRSWVGSEADDQRGQWVHGFEVLRGEREGRCWGTSWGFAVKVSRVGAEV